MVKKTCVSNATLNKFKTLQLHSNGVQKNKKSQEKRSGFKRPKTKNQKKANQVARMMSGCSLTPHKSQVCASQTQDKTTLQKILNRIKENERKRRQNANARRIRETLRLLNRFHH